MIEMSMTPPARCGEPVHLDNVSAGCELIYIKTGGSLTPCFSSFYIHTQMRKLAQVQESFQA